MEMYWLLGWSCGDSLLKMWCLIGCFCGGGTVREVVVNRFEM